MIKVGLQLGSRPLTSAAAIIAFATDTEGWRLSGETIVPGQLSVSRKGYNSTGQEITVSDSPLSFDTLIRQPYPSQATLTEDYALDEFVYSQDTVQSTANNSTRSYPKPIAKWVSPDYSYAENNMLTLKLAVVHAYARNGQAVAAVQFIVTDDALNQVTQTVSSETYEHYPNSNLYAPHYEGTIDVSSLTSDIVTVDAIIYPFVGDSFQLSVDGFAYPSINISTQKAIRQEYGRTYAYVSPTGSNASGIASTSAASASALPFETIAGAISAVRSLNSSTYSRNNAGNSIIYLEPDTYTHSNIRSASGLTIADAPMIISSSQPANKATTIYQDPGSSVSSGLPYRTVYKDLTVKKVSGNVIIFDNAATDESRLLVFDNVDFDVSASTSDYAAFIYRVGVCHMINCSGGTERMTRAFSTVAKHFNMVGCSDHLVGNNAYFMSACRSGAKCQVSDKAAVGSLAASEGMLLLHSIFQNDSSADKVISITNAISDYGFGIVGCFVEKLTSTVPPAVSISADGIVEPAANVVIQGVTIIGSRTNILYQDVGSVRVEKYGFVKNSVFESFNTKTDIFALDGNLTGNWSVSFRVATRSIAAEDGAAANDDYGPGSWLGERPIPNSIDRVDLQIGANGASEYVGLPLILANDASFARDLYNNPITAVGAAQPTRLL